MINDQFFTYILKRLIRQRIYLRDAEQLCIEWSLCICQSSSWRLAQISRALFVQHWETTVFVLRLSLPVRQRITASARVRDDLSVTPVTINQHVCNVYSLPHKKGKKERKNALARIRISPSSA